MSAADLRNDVLCCMFCGATADLVAVQCEGTERVACVVCLDDDEEEAPLAKRTA